MMRRAVICLLLILLTVAVYSPIRHADFTNFDDPDYVTANPNVHKGLRWEGIKWAFTAFHASNWHPLTWISHMADCSLFGENPAGHHLVNVGFHVANTVLLFLCLAGVTGSQWRSAFVAALFAVHPLHVESVAWIAERKDVLSTFFLMLTLLAYARYAEEKRTTIGQAEAAAKSKGLIVWRNYCLALVFFALGLLSKPMLVSLPLLLLAVDYWPLGRMRKEEGLPFKRTILSLVVEKAPFFALAAGSSIVTILAQKSGGAVMSVTRMPIDGRLANAAISYVTYLAKTVLPSNLCAYYPLPADISVVKAAACALVLGLITALAYVARKRQPSLLVGWLWFLITLVPVIGIIQVGSQAMADRYTYIPLIGVFVAVAWAAPDPGPTWFSKRAVQPAAALAIVAGFALFAYAQTMVWRDSLTLFGHTLAITRDNYLAELNLGHALARHGNQLEALIRFDRALRLCPGYPLTYFNRGNSLAVLGRHEEALADYREGLRTKPDHAEAWCNSAKLLAQQLKLEESKAAFLEALRHQPDYPEAHTKLGNVLIMMGQKETAFEHLRKSVQIDPDFYEGHYFLGGALAREGHYAEAAACFRAALKAKPDFVLALNDLAWMLATRKDAIRNVPEAVRLARRACELTQQANPMYLDTLSVALSEAGNMQEALAVAESALALANKSGDAALVAELERRVHTYKQGQSYTQAAAIPK